MLSPASLRVCCLAVMAPALTKADRQADCLPVVLSESFCGSKTPDTYTIKDKICENRLRCAYSSEYTLNKRRPFMRRACWRTQKSGTSFFYKYRTIPNVSSKSLLYSGKVRTQKEAKNKTWLSTKATTAYAGKIKLKYTMNKNTSNARNMGLAKANMSFGLQSLKKMKQFSKENQSSGPINVIEDSMNYSDSADSPVPIGSLITDTDVSPMDNNILSCVSPNVRASDEDASNAVLDTIRENDICKSVTENDSEPFLSSAGADGIETVDVSRTSVTLTDSLSQNLENVESPESISTLPHSFPVSSKITDSCDVELPEKQELAVPIKAGVSDSNVDQSDLPEESRSDKLLESIPLQVSLAKERMSIFSNFKNFRPPVVNGKFSASPTMVSSIFSIFNSSKLLGNASQLISLSNTQTKCSVIPDNRFGLKHIIPVRHEKNMCCLPSRRELDSVESMLVDKSSNIRSALGNSTRLMQKQLISHIRKQISSLVDHYQRKLQIPCQRPARHVSSKSHRDLHDMKAELLQSEDVKSMSTAALVSLVRKLESSGSQSRILPLKATALSNSPDPTENINLSFDSDSIEDIKYTSGVLKSSVKNVLKVSDPYLTESSEEEYESESEDEEDTASDNESTAETSALWNYMSRRTKLGSRSTWLLARVHELEFRIKEYNERLHELEKVEGKVSLDSLPVTESELGVQKSPKQTTGSSFVLPLNGFLDCSDTSHVAVSTSESCQLDLQRTQPCTEASCRTRPLNTGAFRKRKVISIPGLHASSPKFSRLSSVNCNCNSLSDLSPCILCTGQYHSLQTVDPDSMALRDRISILDPYFHPALSTDEDIPIHLHFENILKTNAKYQNDRPPSPEPTTVSEELPGIRPKFSDIRSHRKLSRYARTLSAKYRNKHHRNAKHLRKHKLVFGKWRRLQAKHALRSRNRFRRHSIASSGSSAESPELSPVSVFDDGLASENKKRQDSQFDIDDVIIPCNSRSGRLVEIQYKEIMIPSWRNVENEVLLTELCDAEDIENISDVYLTKRHDALEVEEKEKMKRTALGLNRRARRNRCDSRADSSGANTPDPTSLYNNQENVFLPPNFNAIGGPSSPPPPPSPNSASISDDSQPPFGNGSNVRPEKRKTNQKQRSTEESTSSHNVADYDEEPPYEPLQFPLPDEVYEQLLAESDHNKEVFYLPSNASSFPASPISSSSSTSTVEDEDDDITDPEWTVIKPMRNGPEQALVLKFAKR